MSDIHSHARRVACRVIGSTSPVLERVVDEAVALVEHSLVHALIAPSELREFTRTQTQLIATRSFAAQRTEQALYPPLRATLSGARQAPHVAHLAAYAA